MSLRRKWSDLVRGREGNKSTSNLARGAENGFGASLTSIAEDDDDLSAAIAASFNDELSRLRSELAQARSAIESSQTSEEQQEAKFQQAALASRRSYKVELQRRDYELDQARARLNSLEFSNRLYNDKNEKQAAQIQRLDQENQALQGSLKDLDASHTKRTEVLERQHKDTIQGIWNHFQTLGLDFGNVLQEVEHSRYEAASRRRRTEASFELMKLTNCKLEAAHLEMTVAMTELKAHDTLLADICVEKHNEVESLKGLLEVTAAENQSCSQALVELQDFFGGNKTTPRLVLTMEHYRRLYVSSVSPSVPDSQKLPNDTSIQHIINNNMDVPMDIGSLCRFIVKLRDQGEDFWEVSIENCAICERPKFATAKDTVLPHGLNEFLPRYRKAPCCGKSVCSACLRDSLLAAIQKDWWHSLDSQQWIKCPVDGCDIGFAIPQDTLEHLLHRLKVPDVSLQMTRYKRANALRAALLALEPKPSPEALAAAAKLHKQLIENEKMFDLFDSRFEVAQADDESLHPDFDPGSIVLCETDTNDLKIPIFIKFFRRTEEPVDCSICCESLYDIDTGTTDEWLAATTGFHGPWIWDFLLFPRTIQLECTHPLEFCKTCFSTHLSTQVEQHGRSGCDRLTCPAVCGRTLSPPEIRIFTSLETREKYDNYIFLNYISAQPNFRWCLRDGCENGQLYEHDEAVALDPHVWCGHCEFEMCYTHQIPWHEGMTCAQYDNQREHGDPDFAQTQAYLQGNTKPCPGNNCGMSVEKDGGCFHMTCRSCRHEFCWECLADWSLISPSPGEYNRTAHTTGCWFRANTMEPTQIMGDDLVTALDRRTRGG